MHSHRWGSLCSLSPNSLVNPILGLVLSSSNSIQIPRCCSHPLWLLWGAVQRVKLPPKSTRLPKCCLHPFELLMRGSSKFSTTSHSHFCLLVPLHPLWTTLRDGSKSHWNLNVLFKHISGPRCSQQVNLSHPTLYPRKQQKNMVSVWYDVSSGPSQIGSQSRASPYQRIFSTY